MQSAPTIRPSRVRPTTTAPTGAASCGVSSSTEARVLGVPGGSNLATASTADAVAASHPVAALLDGEAAAEASRRAFLDDNTYGRQMSIRLNMETHILSQYHRLPGLHSEFAGVSGLTGSDETIDFTDFLGGDPRDSITQPDFRAAMERDLGITNPTLL